MTTPKLKPNDLPGWPARMDATLAAAYLGISRSTLAEGVRKGRYPAPVTDGRRRLWAKKALDLFIEREAELEASSHGW